MKGENTMDMVQTLRDWAAANPENPLVDIIVWLAGVIEFIAAL